MPEQSKKQVILGQKTAELNRNLAEQRLTDSLEDNLSALKSLFAKDDTFVLREIRSRQDGNSVFWLAYCAGMVDEDMLSDKIIRPLAAAELDSCGPRLLDDLRTRVITNHNPQVADSLQTIVEAVTYGESALLIPGHAQALVMGVQGFPLRGIAEPDGEKILSGPKEGFCECLIKNLSLLHRKLRTNDLKMEMRTFGRRTATRACVCYLDSLVRPEILGELMERLDQIDIDGALDSNYLTELIRDNSYSAFRTTGYTERPDVVAGKLLEGRIAIFLDGTPVVLTVPYLFVENFQSNEDYYLSFYYTSFSRLIRILGFWLTILAPGIYLATTTYHHEILPTPLLANVAFERQNVPFPMVLELFGMLLMFDILRETGIRMPTGVGQAMSVVGALVLGSAAVEAKIVSSLVIIIVALSGITSLLVPKLNAPIILARLGILFCSALMGLPGLSLAMAVLVAHILSLSSLGVPQITLSGRLRQDALKDHTIRTPWWRMLQRPAELTENRTRMKNAAGRARK